MVATLAWLFAASPGVAQPSGGRVEARGGGRPGGLLAQMTAFKADVPAHPFDIVLARPRRDSITVSVVLREDAEGSIECWQAGHREMFSTSVRPLPAGKFALFELDHLKPDTAYEYRLVHRRIPPDGANAAPMSKSEVYGFHTPRAPSGDGRDAGSAEFTFVIQADSHLDQGVEPRVYEQTLRNMLPPIAPVRPDFMIDLGDTFMTDKRGRDFTNSLAQYEAQRYYFGLVAHSAPLFMALGNHDGEKGTSGKNPGDIGPWSFTQRTSRFPAPVIEGTPGAMYTGSTGMHDGVGSHYYAFEWGDALFIVLDPFWSTTARIRGGGGGNRAGGGERGQGQRPNDEPLKPTDFSWTSTLGRAQYDWLTSTLERSKVKHRFVFIHHLVGGMGGAESRGGVESSRFFEWGGQNADGSPGFAEHREGWAMPIHDLLAKHRVSAVFHGHDHLYVRAERDGVVYQCVPQPGNPRGNTRTAAHYGYASGTIHGSPGHVRVRVEPAKATVELVRTAVEDDRATRRGEHEANAQVVHSFTLRPLSR